LLVVGLGLVLIVEDIGVGCLAGALDIFIGLGFANEITKPAKSQSRNVSRIKTSYVLIVKVVHCGG